MAKIRTAAEWRTARAATSEWAEKVRRAVGSFARTKPRAVDEARVLREAGTPERLIGSSWTSGEHAQDLLGRAQADAALSDELARAFPDTTDDL